MTDVPGSAPADPATEPGWALARTVWTQRPLLLAVVVLASAVLVTVRLGPSSALPAYLVLCLAGTTLGAIDVRTLRLPDAVLLPTGVAVLLLLGLAALDDGGAAFVRALAVGAVGFLLFLALALVNPAGLGFGDVKLAAVLGLAVGHLGWGVALTALLLSFVSVAVTGLTLLALRRVTRSSALPFGPFMLVGALLSIFLGPAGLL